jgi:UDP-N-acetylglucosamine 3-dehydrogenase
MKVGILGTGFGSYHADIYSKISSVESIRIFGRSEDRLKNIKTDLQIDVTNNIQNIISSEDIDLVDICLPSSLHREYAIEAMKNGKNVFCETPVTLSLEDAIAIKEASEKYDKKVFVDMFIKFEQAHKYVYTVTQENTLGKLKALHVRRKTPHLWGDLSLSNISPNLMIHELDFVIWLLGAPNKITASGVNSKEGECNVNALFNYDDVVVEVQASSMMPKSHPFSVEYEAIFENGAIEFVEDGYADRSERSLKLFTDQCMETLELLNRNCYEESIKHVIECCEKNTPTILSIEDAIESLKVALKIKDLLLNP